MTLLIDIRAYLASARLQSFSAAARELGTTPSVISKRVGRLEEEIGVRLFNRTTRALNPTPEGEAMQPRLKELVAELDDVLLNHKVTGIRGELRVRSTTTIGTAFVGPSINRFQIANPSVKVELALLDRPVNPLEEGFDISFGALPQSFGGVVETPLCPYPRTLVASPAYLERRGEPERPADLVDHDCLIFLPVGPTWTFSTDRGPLSVEVRRHYTVNDSRIMVDAAKRGLGLAIAPDFLIRAPLERGDLVPVMPDFPIVTIWFKATIPRHKMHRPTIKALLDHISAECEAEDWDQAL